MNTIDNTVSVINGATCNGKVTSGCGQRPAHAAVGRQFFGFAAVDPATDLVYVSNYRDDTVSVIDGATCNGKVTSGCRPHAADGPAARNPSGPAFDPAHRSVYAADNGGGALSVFRFTRPGRPAALPPAPLTGRPPSSGTGRPTEGCRSCTG